MSQISKNVASKARTFKSQTVKTLSWAEIVKKPSTKIPDSKRKKKKDLISLTKLLKSTESEISLAKQNIAFLGKERYTSLLDNEENERKSMDMRTDDFLKNLSNVTCSQNAILLKEVKTRQELKRLQAKGRKQKKRLIKK